MVTRETIIQGLRAIEAQHDVRVLFAVESGSRAWGFASLNSDYDVRYIYAHPRDWYLSIFPGRDVIEGPLEGEFDYSGWDLKKALTLFHKSNPNIIEWIQSPIFYIDHYLVAELKVLLLDSYNPMAGKYHYRSMASTNYRMYLKNDLVPLKKYFYVLRPLFAVRWIEAHGTAPPIEYYKLADFISGDEPEVYEAAQRLLAMKLASTEKEMIPREPVVNAFVERELRRLDIVKHQGTKVADKYKLDKIFRTYVK